MMLLTNKMVRVAMMGLVALMAHDVAATPFQDSVYSSFIQKAIDSAQPKMVKVYGAGAGRVDGFATGILVSNDGLVLTSQGVILDGKQVRVVLSDGSTHQASILKRDRETQLALLKIDAQPSDFFQLSESTVGEKGDWVVALSNAFKVADKEEPLSATLGIISLRTTMEARLTRRDVAYNGELVLVDAITSNPGAAGGAVITADGQLVGMIGKLINSSETNTRLNYAVPTSVMAAFINEKDDPVANASSKTVTQSAELGIKLFKFGGRNNPAYIDRVVRGSPAAKAGFQPDDMVVSIAGNKIGSVKDYAQVLKMLRPDEEVLVIVKRGAELLRIRVTPRAKD